MSLCFQWQVQLFQKMETVSFHIQYDAAKDIILHSMPQTAKIIMLSQGQMISTEHNNIKYSRHYLFMVYFIHSP